MTVFPSKHRRWPSCRSSCPGVKIFWVLPSHQRHGPSPGAQICFCDRSAVTALADLLGFDKAGLGSNLTSSPAGRFGDPL